MSEATVLITGGSGFLGRHLGRDLKGSYRTVLAARNNKVNLEAAQRTGCRNLSTTMGHSTGLIREQCPMW